MMSTNYRFVRIKVFFFCSSLASGFDARNVSTFLKERSHDVHMIKALDLRFIDLQS